MKLLAAVVFAACLGAAIGQEHVCTTGMKAVITCHHNQPASDAPHVPDHFSEDRDESDNNNRYDHHCCSMVQQYRAGCDVEDTFTYWPTDISDHDSLILQYYLEKCFHHSSESCHGAVTELLECIKTEQDTDSHSEVAGCCDAMDFYRDRCIHRQVLFQSEVGTNEDDSDDPRERVIVDDMYKSYVDSEAVPGMDNAGRFERYFPDEEGEDTREGGLCGLYEYGEGSCTATRQLLATCVDNVLSVDASHDLSTTSCCWQSERAWDFCGGEDAPESYFMSISHPEHVRDVLDECRPHRGGGDHYCHYTLPDHYHYRGGFVAPCGWSGTMGFATHWNGRDFCWKHLNNAHPVPECWHNNGGGPHGSDSSDNGYYHGAGSGSSGSGSSDSGREPPAQRRLLKRMSMK